MAEPKETTSTIKDLELDGYKFQVDTDLLDDVEAFEYIDNIENKGQVASIVPLLTFMIGTRGYAEMKAHFAAKDATDHVEALKTAGKPVDPDYKGRMRMEKLQDVYLAIIAKFDPKG